MLDQDNKTKINQALKGQNEKTFFIHQYINISIHLYIKIRILCNNQEGFELLVQDHILGLVTGTKTLQDLNDWNVKTASSVLCGKGGVGKGESKLS